jgi:hypothetical protein
MGVPQHWYAWYFIELTSRDWGLDEAPRFKIEISTDLLTVILNDMYSGGFSLN